MANLILIRGNDNRLFYASQLQWIEYQSDRVGGLTGIGFYLLAWRIQRAIYHNGRLYYHIPDEAVDYIMDRLL